MVALRSVLVAASPRDPFVAEFVRILRSRVYEVLVCHDSDTALRLVQSNNPAVIVLDTVLRDGDGLLLCKQLKTNPATASIPVFCFSVLMARDRCIEAGANGFMLKPVEQEMLLERIREVVDVGLRRLPRNF